MPRFSSKSPRLLLSTPYIQEDDDVSKGPTPKRPEKDGDGSVSWIKCRPHTRERIFAAEKLNKTPSASPNKIFKSIISTLSRKSPRPSEISPAVTEEHWKIVAELSHKLVLATRKRDEALLEASRLKYSMAEFENKLTELELCCHSLKSGLEECGANTSPFRKKLHYHDMVVEQFLVSVSESRSSVRQLSRLLTVQLQHTGTKLNERISILLQPYDLKINSLSKNTKSVLFYLEALLNKTLFEDFESGFRKNPSCPILNPIGQCQANYASYGVVHMLTWEEVLDKGTKHFCGRFSRFCDQKMSEIVAMLGWNRPWTEPLLQAFFRAAKSVWLVHLLATSVHPGLPIFRVDKGLKFDPVYMEEMGSDRDLTLVPSAVRIMVTPGFYVYDNVVKCKVLCQYHDDNSNANGLVVADNP